jgi:UDP-N-acetylglucosamine 2-epimerase (non-hydrolysing)
MEKEGIETLMPTERNRDAKQRVMKVILVAGARPNFMKIAPLVRAIRRHNEYPDHSDTRIEFLLVHTGQHYDIQMSEVFFRDLGLPKPDINLEVGSASHAAQTAKIMTGFEEVCLAEKPGWVVVVGDVNSTMACTLVAAKLGIKVAHVEAGLRSFDRSMPEEINRLVTDALADLLLTPSPDADENLIREGIPREKIRRVGNVMIDTLIDNLDQARQMRATERLGLKEHGYVFVTLHRPSNVDNEKSLTSIMGTLFDLSSKMDVVFPVHPRTRKQLATFGIMEMARQFPRLIITDPLNYLDTISLVEKARFVITDSGGLQEETTYLRIPCLTVRPNTERPITISQGSNQLTSLETIKSDIETVLNGYHRQCRIPDLWDGNAGRRIISELIQFQANN